LGTFDLVISSAGTCSPGTCWASLEPDLFAPGVTSGNTCGQCNNCSARPSEDEIVPVMIPYAGQWVFSLCNSTFDNYLLLGTQPCTGDIYMRDDTCGVGATTPCLTLDAGQYFVTIEAYRPEYCGSYELTVNPCPLPAPLDLVIIASPPDVTLYWTAPAGCYVSYFTIYRSTDPSLVVAPGNAVGYTVNTYFQDWGASSDRYYYAVTAVAP
jgi:hypothetical protein